MVTMVNCMFWRVVTSQWRFDRVRCSSFLWDAPSSNSFTRTSSIHRSYEITDVRLPHHDCDIPSLNYIFQSKVSHVPGLSSFFISRLPGMRSSSLILCISLRIYSSIGRYCNRRVSCHQHDSERHQDVGKFCRRTRTSCWRLKQYQLRLHFDPNQARSWRPNTVNVVWKLSSNLAIVNEREVLLRCAWN